MRLIRALRDCRQRSLTVSKKTLTVSKKKLPPPENHLRLPEKGSGHWVTTLRALTALSLFKEVVAALIKAATPQPEIIAKLIPKTVSYGTEMRFSKERVPKRFFHVIL